MYNMICFNFRFRPQATYYQCKILDNHITTQFLTFMEPCIARCVFYIINEMQLIQFSLLLSALYMFRAVFPPIIRSLQNSMCSLGYCHAFLLSTVGVERLEPLSLTLWRRNFLLNFSTLCI